MPDIIRLSIDVMGGDLGVDVIIKGTDIFFKANKDVFFNFYGDLNAINNSLKNFPELAKNSRAIMSNSVISNDAKPSSVIRSYQDSSMRMAIDSVKNNESDGVVSCGNTGALMAMAKIHIGTLNGIDRPAILALIPSFNGCFAMLDMGANIDCSTETLLQFAIMGNAYAKTVLQKEFPKIALLNIGSEPIKGKPEIKKTAELLQNEFTEINFTGYIEPSEIFLGKADVVVVDGFSGNIAVKTMAGISKFFKHVLREEGINGNIATKTMLYFMRNFFKRAYKRMDHRNFNGGPLLGINGVVVKSHGSADEFAFSQAIVCAHTMIKNQINQKIDAQMGKIIAT